MLSSLNRTIKEVNATMGRVVTAALLAFVLLPSSAGAQDLRLIEAVRDDRGGAAAALLAAGVDVGARQPDGATALHWAAHRDDIESADRLLAAGADADAPNDYGVTPLFLAATNGSAAMIGRLIEAGADPRAALPAGETVLMTAARTGSPAAARVLIEHGADVNARQVSKGQTPLMWVVSEGHLEVARVLLAHGAEVGARTKGAFTPLLFAARTGDRDMADLLLEHGADINDVATDGSTPLVVATVRGHAQFAILMLDHGAWPDGDPEAIGYTPLHWASTRSEGVVTNDYPDAPGEWAALAGIPDRAGKIALINALLDHGADVNALVTKDLPRYGFALFPRHYLPGATPFYLAALVADVEVMRLLLDRGADPGINARGDITPLMVAAGLAHMDNESVVPEEDRLAAVKLAVEAGNDIHALNRRGFNAMHGAAFAGQDSVIAWLAGQGAALSVVAGNGQTPLGIAEGNNLSGFFADRPSTAVLLRELGAVAEGSVTLQTAIDQQNERRELQQRTGAEAADGSEARPQR